MTREESKMMQGVGILTMIFYHLFNPSFNHGLSSTVLGNMGRAANPVPLYCLLSGYGLYLVFRHGKDRHRFIRCFRLYFRYWFITALFVFVEVCLFRDYRCTFSIKEILFNITDWKASYYPPAWFILPYCILNLSSFWIFRITEKMNTWIILFLAYCVYLFSSRMNNYSWFGLNIFQTLYIFFPFVLGGVMAKLDIVEKANLILSKTNIWIVLAILALLFLLRYFIYTGAVVSFFWMGVIIVVINVVRRIPYCYKVFLFFGHHNFNMWMIHAWICWYFLHDFIIRLGNPILIYFTVLSICLIVSLILDVFIIPLESKIIREHAK